MNKREREALCAKIAQWEWQQGGSSSEAGAFARCGREMVELFGLTDADMSFHRAWELYSQTKGSSDDEDYLDDLCDRADTDYAGLAELVEETGFDGLRARIRASLDLATDAEG